MNLVLFNDILGILFYIKKNVFRRPAKYVEQIETGQRSLEFLDTVLR